MALLENGPIMVIILAIVLLFGATQIPRLARALGRAQGEFKKAKSEFTSAAARAEAEATPPGPDEEQVRRSARDLGIDEQGKSLDEVKRLIQQRLA